MQKSESKTPAKTRSKMFNHQVQCIQGSTPLKFSTGNGKTPLKLKICSWNINGIRNAITKNILNSFIFQNRPDILCINETKIDKESYLKHPATLYGYNDYWSFCKVSAGYSGVAVFTKVMPIQVQLDLEEAEYSQEGRVLTLQFEHFYLIAAYIPSAGKTLDRLNYKTQKFQPAFHKHCQNIRKRGKGVIICGDLNTAANHIDTHFTGYTFKSPGFTQVERKSLKKFLDRGWIDAFRKVNPEVSKFSWWHIKHNGRQNRIGKRLDYFLINEQFQSVLIGSDVMQEVLGSDHSPIWITIDLNLRPNPEDLEKYANFSWKKKNEVQEDPTERTKQQQQPPKNSTSNADASQKAKQQQKQRKQQKQQKGKEEQPVQDKDSKEDACKYIKQTQKHPL